MGAGKGCDSIRLAPSTALREGPQACLLHALLLRMEGGYPGAALQVA